MMTQGCAQGCLQGLWMKRRTSQEVSGLRPFDLYYPLHPSTPPPGANYLKPWHSPEGIGGLALVNYAGPYLLTRLLEDLLQASAPARVVNVSSVTHRYGFIGPPGARARRAFRGHVKMDYTGTWKGQTD